MVLSGSMFSCPCYEGFPFLSIYVRVNLVVPKTLKNVMTIHFYSLYQPLAGPIVLLHFQIFVEWIEIAVDLSGANSKKFLLRI